MFGIGGNKVLEMQIKAAETESMDLLNDTEESPLIRANTLRQIVQMKERAARFILEEMESMIARFTVHGISSVSLVAIAEAYQQAIEASTSQMQIFANEWAGLTNNPNSIDGYSHISERLSTYAEDLVKPLRESKEKALSGVDSMVFFEIYETWHNMEEKPI